MRDAPWTVGIAVCALVAREAYVAADAAGVLWTENEVHQEHPMQEDHERHGMKHIYRRHWETVCILAALFAAQSVFTFAQSVCTFANLRKRNECP